MVGMPARWLHRSAVVVPAWLRWSAQDSLTGQPHQRHICGWDNNLWQDRTLSFERAHATGLPCGLHASDRTLSLRAMHRLPSAWIEPELAEWRLHHAEHGGRHDMHDTISPLLHQQLNANYYRVFHMYLTYIYASPAHAEPTHRCASNAPNSPAHTRIFVSHKTKASSAPLAPLQ